MQPLNIGVDIDGVLADFNASFIDYVINVTGKDLFPKRPFPIPTWNYPQHYGYTQAEVSGVWDTIKEDRMFWRNLDPYTGTIDALGYLRRLELNSDCAVYFITARLGVACKRQTQDWLELFTPALHRYIWRPTVIISASKGQVAQALDLDVYIDDRWENCEDVRHKAAGCRVFLMDRPWNADAPDHEYGIIRTDRVVGIASPDVARIAGTAA